jgi:hypothetical protein
VQINKLTDFLQKHWSVCRQWDEARLRDWVEWFRDDGRLGIVTSKGEIIGIGVARRVHEISQIHNHYVHEEYGEILWIDFIAVSNKRSLRALWMLKERRFLEGIRWIGFQRGIRNEKIHLYPFQQFNNRMKGKTNYGINS